MVFQVTFGRRAPLWRRIRAIPDKSNTENHPVSLPEFLG